MRSRFAVLHCDAIDACCDVFGSTADDGGDAEADTIGIDIIIRRFEPGKWFDDADDDDGGADDGCC